MVEGGTQPWKDALALGKLLPFTVVFCSLCLLKDLVPDLCTVLVAGKTLGVVNSRVCFWLNELSSACGSHPVLI